MKNKIKYLGLLVLIPLVLCGCWDKKEFTEVSFATTMAIDKEEEEYIVTVKLMLPKDEKQGGEEAPVWLIEGRGTSIYEAIEDLNNRSPREAHWGHMMLIILGEGALDGVDSCLDYFSRNSQFRRTDYIIVTEGKGAEMLALSNEQSKVNKFYIYTLLKDMDGRYKGAAVTLNDCFLWSHYQGGGAYLLPKISAAQAGTLAGEQEQIPQLQGGALIQNDRLVGWMPDELMEGYRFVTNKIGQGALVIDNPLGAGKLSMTIKQSAAEMSWKNETLTIKIKGKVNLTEILGAKNVVGEKHSEKKVLEARVNEYVQQKVEECVKYSLEQNIDFLHLGQWLNCYHHRDFMRYDGDDYLQKLNIEIQSDFKLKMAATAD